MAWLNYMDDQGLLPGILFSCMLHELGHLTVLHGLGIPVKGIRVTTVGAEICMQGEITYHQELLAALAGPMVNFLIACVCCRISGGELLAGMNLALGGFNLIPVGALDGGRALNCLLELTIGRGRGEQITKLLSLVLICFLCATGGYLLVWGGNPTLLLVSLWLMTTVWRG